MCLSNGCRQATAALAEASEARQLADASAAQLQSIQAEATERQKRFSMLNGTFKSREGKLRQEIEALQSQAADAAASAEAAQQQKAFALEVSNCPEWPSSLWVTIRCCPSPSTPLGLVSV